MTEERMRRWRIATVALNLVAGVAWVAAGQPALAVVWFALAALNLCLLMM